MDVAFHAVSAGMLARGLGEKRPKELIYAALIGISPDALWVLATLNPDLRYLYSWNHSLLINLSVCLLLCCFNWRIAFGGMLHLLFDIFTHQSSTMHLFYPFADPKLSIGINWWTWPGLMLWAILWTALLSIVVIFFLPEYLLKSKPQNR